MIIKYLISFGLASSTALDKYQYYWSELCWEIFEVGAVVRASLFLNVHYLF